MPVEEFDECLWVVIMEYVTQGRRTSNGRISLNLACGLLRSTPIFISTSMSSYSVVHTTLHAQITRSSNTFG